MRGLDASTLQLIIRQSVQEEIEASDIVKGLRKDVRRLTKNSRSQKKVILSLVGEVQKLRSVGGSCIPTIAQQAEINENVRALAKSNVSELISLNADLIKLKEEWLQEILGSTGFIDSAVRRKKVGNLSRISNSLFL